MLAEAVGLAAKSVGLREKPRFPAKIRLKREMIVPIGFVQVQPLGEASQPEGGYFDPTACNGTNRAELFVYGNADQALVLCRLDNLGKGASGAAVQCMNLALGLPETAGLE